MSGTEITTRHMLFSLIVSLLPATDWTCDFTFRPALSLVHRKIPRKIFFRRYNILFVNLLVGELFPAAEFRMKIPPKSPLNMPSHRPVSPVLNLTVEYFIPRLSWRTFVVGYSLKALANRFEQGFRSGDTGMAGSYVVSVCPGRDGRQCYRPESGDRLGPRRKNLTLCFFTVHSLQKSNAAENLHEGFSRRFSFDISIAN
jgi:hypothetical protein